MIRNYIKIAWRHLLKNKFISSINLAGLVVGMTAFLFIWQYVHYERSYDIFHENADRIFRVRTDRIKDGVPFMQFAAGTACAGPLLKENFPEVEDYVKLTPSSDAVYSNRKGDSFKETKVYYAMPSLFDIFSFSLLQGDAETCLSEPFAACLSETTAKKMFGEENPIGKTITRNGGDEFKITGVFEDCPSNSHFKFNILLSYITYTDVYYEGQGTETSPTWDGYYAYLLLKPNTDWKALEAKIPGVIEKTYDQETSERVQLFLQPLKDIHLTSNYLIEAEVNGDGNAVRFLYIIGFFVLFIAWLNYINLSTARSEMRAKEVGVRKVVGSSRGNLVRLFMTEATILNIIAIIAAFALVQIFHPLFENLIGKPLPKTVFSDGTLFLLTIGTLLIGTILTGLYPAFLLSSFKPISVLKSGFTENRGRGNWLRKGLVVLQFIASVGLIASTLIIYQQLHYMQETKLGVNIDQMLVVKGPNITDSTFVAHTTVFKEEIRQIGNVKNISNSTTVPGQEFGWTAGGVRRYGAPEEESESFHAMAADVNYSKLYEMELVAGRHMLEEMGGDRMACLLNEKGAKLLKFKTPEEAIGVDINLWGDRLTVAGVLKDFHQESPKEVVEPLILRAMPTQWIPGYYSIKVSAQNIAQSLANIESIWEVQFPGNPFEYFFLDNHFNAQYAADQRFGRIFSLFSGLAILVSCLGLFALVAFVVERKRKEIGIRKVLGASVSSIVGLLSRDFIMLILLALLIATPFSWYFMDGWLNNFVKRITIPWWVFGVSGLAVIVIAFLTMSIQSVRAALANPVESLRDE